MIAVSTRQLVLSSAEVEHGEDWAPVEGVGGRTDGRTDSVGLAHLSLLPYTQPSSGPSGKETSSSESRPGSPAVGEKQAWGRRDVREQRPDVLWLHDTDKKFCITAHATAMDHNSRDFKKKKQIFFIKKRFNELNGAKNSSAFENKPTKSLINLRCDFVVWGFHDFILRSDCEESPCSSDEIM